MLPVHDNNASFLYISIGVLESHHCWGHLAQLLGGQSGCHLVAISSREHPSFHHQWERFARLLGSQMVCQLFSHLHRGRSQLFLPLLGAPHPPYGRPMELPSSCRLFQGHLSFHRCWGSLAGLLGGHGGCHLLVILSKGRPTIHCCKGCFACLLGS
jgi:hypothetical protein